jgi:hypothetical protein
MSEHVVLIPDDGAEHKCVCGRGMFHVWDTDGWAGRWVCDDDGRAQSTCPGCDRELHPA